jgi:hypothetical protein
MVRCFHKNNHEVKIQIKEETTEKNQAISYVDKYDTNENKFAYKTNCLALKNFI